MLRSTTSRHEPVTVSVIIPTYRHANLVEETLRSVFSQTHLPLEVIVVNDGSPDDTEEVLAPWRAHNRIVYIHQENRGQAHARNRGIEVARGTYIALLDDDDLWPSEKLNWQVAAFQERPNTVLVYGGVAPFLLSNALPTSLGSNPGDELLPSGNALPQFMRRNWIVSPGQTLIRRAALQKIGGFDSSIWGCDDYDLYIRLAKVGEFHFSPRIALYYRRHAGNASRNIDRMYVNHRAVHRKHWGDRPFLEQAWPFVRARWCLQHYFFERFFREAREAYDRGDYQAHRHFLWRAIQVFPAGAIRRSYLRSILKMFRN